LEQDQNEQGQNRFRCLNLVLFTATSGRSKTTQATSSVARTSFVTRTPPNPFSLVTIALRSRFSGHFQTIRETARREFFRYFNTLAPATPSVQPAAFIIFPVDRFELGPRAERPPDRRNARFTIQIADKKSAQVTAPSRRRREKHRPRSATTRPRAHSDMAQFFVTFRGSINGQAKTGTNRVRITTHPVLPALFSTSTGSRSR
jgi:hypothetical protein